MDNIVHPGTIRKWCVKLGLPYRHAIGPRSRMTPKIKERLLALASRQPPPYFSEIARAIGNTVCPATLKIWCEKLGLAYRRDYGMPGRIPPGTEKRLRALLAEQPSPYFSEISRAIGRKVDRRTIKKWCAYLGLPYKPVPGLRNNLTPEMGERMRTLLAERPSITHKELIAAMGNIACRDTIIAWRKKMGLPCRAASRRESLKLTPEMEERLRLLVAERPTASHPALARELQVPPINVWRWVRRLGLPHDNHGK